MRTKSHGPAARIDPRVIWTDAEKAEMVMQAVEIRANNPDLAGLQLLRVAMVSLPYSRRRKLIAVTQAPWFEPGVEAEVKRRTSELKASASFVPLASEFRATQMQWHDESVKWMTATTALQRMNAQANESAVAMLTLIHQELVKLNEVLCRAASLARAPRLYDEQNGQRRDDGQQNS